MSSLKEGEFMRFLSLLLMVSACAVNGSKLASALDSERCGLASFSAEKISFIDANTGKSRTIEHRDGATTNVLKQFATNKKPVCITGDWSAAGPIIVTSASRVREGKDLMSEECGTVMETEGGLFIELSGGNSEDNAQRQLAPATPALKKLIADRAANLDEVCIKADFKKNPVEISSPEQIRSWFR